LKPSPTAATPTPNPQGFYYVFVKYDGESSLQQARKVVPDAYLSPEGTQIYLGAFKKESQAKTLVKELQTQGISAAVDQP
jgi:cell division septation protein DedD